MLTTLAEIWTLAWQGLGAPEDENVRLQIMRAVNEVSALKWSGVRQSNQNQYIQPTDEITFNNNECLYEMSDFWTGPVIPAWVEVRSGNRADFGANGNNGWGPVTVCNRDALQQFRNRGDSACSFFSTPNEGQATTTDYIEWSFTPQWFDGSRFRVWYSPAINLSVLDNATTGLPTEFNYYIAILARIKVIPVLKQQLVAEASRNDRDKDFVKMQLGIWDQMLVEAKAETPEWEERWKWWKNASRGQQNNRKKRPIYKAYL